MKQILPASLVLLMLNNNCLIIQFVFAKTIPINLKTKMNYANYVQIIKFKTLKTNMNANVLQGNWFQPQQKLYLG